MQGGRVWIVNADGSNLITLDAGGVVPPRPLWSPSGDFIAFISTENGATDLNLVAPDGTGRRSIAATAGVVEDLQRWIP